METLALTGRPGLHGPFGPYLPHHLHIPPSTWRFGPDRRAGARGARPGPGAGGPRHRLRVLLRGDQRRGAARIHAARRLLGGPGRTPRSPRLPRLLRRGGHRRRANRPSGSPGSGTACTPDVIATAKGLGAGYAAIGAVLCREPRVRGRRERVAPVHARAHVGRRAAVVRGRARGAGRPAVRGARSPHVRERGRRLRDELEARAGRRPDGAARSAATATCSGCRTSIRATALVPAVASSGSRAGSTRPRSSAG